MKNTPYQDKVLTHRIDYRPNMAGEIDRIKRDIGIIRLYEQIALNNIIGINSCSELDYIVFIPSPDQWSERVH